MNIKLIRHKVDGKEVVHTNVAVDQMNRSINFWCNICRDFYWPAIGSYAPEEIEKLKYDKNKR
jgi:hypothetical protein